MHYIHNCLCQAEIDQHVSSHNNHKISTEENRTPTQLAEMFAGLAKDPVQVDEGEYGVEDDDEFFNDDEDSSVYVNLEPRVCPLDEEDLSIFQEMAPSVTVFTPIDELAPAFVNALRLIRIMLEDY